MSENVCIIGGGIAGVGLWWCLSQPDQPGHQSNVTLLHSETQLGGHAYTVPITYKGQQIPVDTGVQFYVPLLYRNIDAIVRRPEFSAVRVTPYDGLKVGCAFAPAAGAPQNWGNFPAYGATGQSQPANSQFAMYTPSISAVEPRD